MVKALADRLAEAFAERLHERVRARVLGLRAGRGARQRRRSIREKYRGIRPAPGYPACPDHTEKRTLFELLARRDATPASRSPRASRCCPAASVSGYYFSHPEAHYFGVGKIERDQVEDYARRKGMDLRRWSAGSPPT